MSKGRLNPMRMPPTAKDTFAKTLIATLFAANVAGMTMLGLMSMSENDPRKKEGPVLRRHIDNKNMSGLFDIDWEQSKLEWIDLLNGIKIGGVQIFYPKPDAPKLEDYLQAKEEIRQVERTKEAERKAAS